jgi:hypothetical protein
VTRSHQKSACTFSVKEGLDDTLDIAVHWDVDASVFFRLPPGTTLKRAEEIAEFMNLNIRTVCYSPALSQKG